MNPPEVEFLTTKELADLLRIKERKVYDLVAAGEVPCSRATGKLLFSRRAIDAWIASRSSGPVQAVDVVRPSVVLGSHEPLLEWAIRESQADLATHLDGSLDGLARFAAGEGIAAGLHLYAPEEDSWNVDAVRSRFTGLPVVLVEFAWRERGLIFTPNQAGRFSGVDSLRNCRLVTRQPAAGSQTLLEHLLADAGIRDAVELGPLVRSETDAAAAVASGKADAALGLRGVAHQHGLEFLSLLQERFDLLVDRRAWFEAPMQAFLTFCRSEAFQERAAEMPGYDARGLGKVHFNG